VTAALDASGSWRAMAMARSRWAVTFAESNVMLTIAHADITVVCCTGGAECSCGVVSI
jgi:hypothetical protein